MGIISIKNGGLFYTTRDENIIIEPYGNNCARVRASRNTRISDERWTLLAPEDCQAEVQLEENRGILKNGSLTVVLTKYWSGFQIEFQRNGETVLSTVEEADAVTRYSHISGDNYRICMKFAARDEHIYGLGQEQQTFFDRKGCTYDLEHRNTKSSLPVIYSSLGYGFLWNNPSPGKVEFGLNRTVWTANCSYQADYLVFVGDTPAQVLNTYCRLTGFAPKMPQWAAGFWQSKCRYKSQEDLVEAAREYHRRGIPVDAIVIDFFHWTEQGNCDFDPKYWQDPEGMIKELKEMGMRPIVSYWPTINPNSRNWQEMNERNMLVRTENGQYGTFDFFGQQTYVDMTNPEARDYVWEQIQKTYIKYGIRTFWLDQAEPELHPQQWSNFRLNAGNMAESGLLYPYYYAKCFYDGLKSEGEDEIVLLTRAAYPGSQKFGALVWNGDIGSDFWALRHSVISGLSMAMCGIPWWNSDIGGFHGADTESDYFRELVVRWFQFGLFCPVMRLHGDRRKQSDYVDKYPDIICNFGGYNEIWKFGESAYNIIKEIIELRYRLKPYILECAERTSETGEPIMRPMFFDFPKDENCYRLSDQYMFGKDILFAPILEQGQTEREVYLPEGNWIRTTDKTVVSGGKTVKAKAELNEFIAYVREGAKVIEQF